MPPSSLQHCPILHVVQQLSFCCAHFTPLLAALLRLSPMRMCCWCPSTRTVRARGVGTMQQVAAACMLHGMGGGSLGRKCVANICAHLLCPTKLTYCMWPTCTLCLFFAFAHMPWFCPLDPHPGSWACRTFAACQGVSCPTLSSPSVIAQPTHVRKRCRSARLGHGGLGVADFAFAQVFVTLAAPRKKPATHENVVCSFLRNFLPKSLRPHQLRPPWRPCEWSRAPCSSCWPWLSTLPQVK